MKLLPTEEDDSNTIQINTNSIQNQELYQKALEIEKDDRLLEAARILRNLESCETKEHEEILKRAAKCESILEQLQNPADPSWNKIKDSYKNKDLTVHFKVKKKTNVCCRIDSIIDKSLLCPLLSVLNETELYATWLPSWNVPKFQVRQSKKLHQRGRVSQVILLSIDLPWPVKPREVIIDATAFDDISTNGEICIMLEGVNESNNEYIPSQPEPNHVRVVFKGGFLFRKYKHHDDLIEVSFYITYDTIYFQIPEALLNFLLKVAAAKMFKKFLKVAEDVRDGIRMEHKMCIHRKRGILYDWVDQRVEMLVTS